MAGRRPGDIQAVRYPIEYIFPTERRIVDAGRRGRETLQMDRHALFFERVAKLGDIAGIEPVMLTLGYQDRALDAAYDAIGAVFRSEEHTSELQSRP